MNSQLSTHYIPAEYEAIEEKTRIYLGLLAVRKPFYMEVTATPFQAFEQLELRWPNLDGWEYHAGQLLHRLQTLAEPLIESGNDRDLLRLAVNVAIAPIAPFPKADAAAVHAVFDVDHGMITHRAYSETDLPFNPTLDDVSLGMAVLYQQVPENKNMPISHLEASASIPAHHETDNDMAALPSIMPKKPMMHYPH